MLLVVGLLVVLRLVAKRVPDQLSQGLDSVLVRCLVVVVEELLAGFELLVALLALEKVLLELSRIFLGQFAVGELLLREQVEEVVDGAARHEFVEGREQGLLVAGGADERVQVALVGVPLERLKILH